MRCQPLSSKKHTAETLGRPSFFNLKAALQHRANCMPSRCFVPAVSHFGPGRLPNRTVRLTFPVKSAKRRSHSKNSTRGCRHA
jgi:hypothetical protein